MAYDPNNIFAKILRDEIPNETVLETDQILAFKDIAPQAPIHVLVIPKGQYTDIGDFSSRASTDEIEAFWQAVSKIVNDHKLNETGYRIICNTGSDGGQEVPHFHAHILGGAAIGPMVSR